MKKLVLACCAVVVIGGCMALGGWAAGGQLYGSYYDGALHPVSETIRDASRLMRDHISYHTWWADGARHSGWFDDDAFEARVEDVVNDRVDKALEKFNQDWSEAEPGTLPPFSLPKTNLDNISSLDLTCKSGTSNRFTIDSGTAFGLEGDFSIVSNEFDNGTWELEIVANGDEVIITLPDLISTYDSIEITSRLDALIDITLPLYASKIELYAESGSIDAELLSAPELDLTVCDGLLYAYLGGQPDLYRIEAKTNYGPVTLNGEELVGPDSGVSRYDNRKSITAPSYEELEIMVSGGGSAELYTME